MGPAMRRLIAIDCAGDTIVATLDEASATTGLLIVSGGNEVRAGAHRGMALLAARLAAAGVPVLRYDRRGIGDSGGDHTGFEGSTADIAAAATGFRGHGVSRIVAFGNCDAASALALFHADAGIDALLLSNPWTGSGGGDGMPAPAAIRARYAERLRNPRAWLRLLCGDVNLRKLMNGLGKLASVDSEDGSLVDRMAAGIAASGVPTTILLADRDNTAIAFRNAWQRSGRPTTATKSRDSASHSYAGPGDGDWLFERLLEATAYSAA